MLDTQSLTALAAIAVVLPLAAGGIDLAVGAEIGFGSILVAALISKAGWSSDGGRTRGSRRWRPGGMRWLVY